MPLKRKKRKAARKKIVKRKVIKKRLIKKKPTKKKVRKNIVVAKKTKENIVGKVTHYFPKVSAAVVKLKSPLAVGDTIKIKGHTTDFTQNITSMQIEHVPINQAKKGQEIGLLVNSRVRRNDTVCKL